jgi:hypothetical protein
MKRGYDAPARLAKHFWHPAAAATTVRKKHSLDISHACRKLRPRFSSLIDYDRTVHAVVPRRSPEGLKDLESGHPAIAYRRRAQ